MLRLIEWAAWQVGRGMRALDRVDAWLDRQWGRVTGEDS